MSVSATWSLAATETAPSCARMPTAPASRAASATARRGPARTRRASPWGRARALTLRSQTAWTSQAAGGTVGVRHALSSRRKAPAARRPSRRTWRIGRRAMCSWFGGRAVPLVGCAASAPTVHQSTWSRRRVRKAYARMTWSTGRPSAAAASAGRAGTATLSSSLPTSRRLARKLAVCADLTPKTCGRGRPAPCSTQRRPPRQRCTSTRSRRRPPGSSKTLRFMRSRSVDMAEEEEVHHLRVPSHVVGDPFPARSGQSWRARHGGAL
mmetsp:Transcript_82850/g.213491  ORF Transcript_82850/g.213491 Transcript_82850/m.213491 type:complete len:267 (-) Transcript_82850:80-880(-)